MQSVKSQVPQSLHGPIVQVYEHDGARRLVAALPNSRSHPSVARMVDNDRRMGILLRPQTRIEE